MHQAYNEERKLHERVTESAKMIDLSCDPTAAIDACNSIATNSVDPTLIPENTVEAWGEER
jgi:hypothetical protein